MDNYGFYLIHYLLTYTLFTCLLIFPKYLNKSLFLFVCLLFFSFSVWFRSNWNKSVFGIEYDWKERWKSAESIHWIHLIHFIWIVFFTWKPSAQQTCFYRVSFFKQKRNNRKETTEKKQQKRNNTTKQNKNAERISLSRFHGYVRTLKESDNNNNKLTEKQKCIENWTHLAATDWKLKLTDISLSKWTIDPRNMSLQYQQKNC